MNHPRHRILLFVPLALCALARAADRPPAAPVRNVTDTYHGTRVDDPYRYFEDFKAPEVQAWTRAQADHATATLHAIQSRDKLLARIQELDEGVPYRLTVVRRWPNGDLHYLKRMASDNLEKLYFRDGKTNQERLLVDPEQLARAEGQPPEVHYSIAFAVPSPDGRFVAYGVAASGSEQTVLHVLDSATAKDLLGEKPIDRMEADYTPPAWLPDSGGFVYSRRRKLPADAPATELWQKTYACLHRLGTDADGDPVVFAKDSPAGAVEMADADFPSVVIPRGSAWAIGKIKHGDANDLTLYAAPVAALAGTSKIPWTKVCDARDEVKDFAVHGEDAYLVSAAGAPRYKVVRTPLAAPDFKSATVVLPAGAAVVESIASAKDALYVDVLDGGMNRVLRVPYGADAKPQTIPSPELAPSWSIAHPEPDVAGVLINGQSWTRAGKVWEYDPDTELLSDTGLRPRGRFDDPQSLGLALVSTEVQVTSHDGVKVPLSIVHRKGLKLDGSNPALAIGYGAYGMPVNVGYRPGNLAWFERGGVLAFAHVRGGGAYGKEWHLAGQKATKPNTWKDFIACCEYLVDKGYTSREKLAGQGGSAGGILIGRAITERPDLFAAAVIDVGCLDMVRSETTTNGVPNIQEFGSSATKEGFDALLAMSAYHHVKDGVKYPAVLLTHGVNDPRVEAWMSAKMAARLQAATAGGKPVLFRVDYQAGHGIGSTRKQQQEEDADSLAFLLWQLGHADFRGN
jgi:prolyl oligopeptidase